MDPSAPPFEDNNQFSAPMQQPIGPNSSSYSSSVSYLPPSSTSNPTTNYYPPIFTYQSLGVSKPHESLTQSAPNPPLVAQPNQSAVYVQQPPQHYSPGYQQDYALHQPVGSSQYAQHVQAVSEPPKKAGCRCMIPTIVLFVDLLAVILAAISVFTHYWVEVTYTILNTGYRVFLGLYEEKTCSYLLGVQQGCTFSDNLPTSAENAGDYVLILMLTMLVLLVVINLINCCQGCMGSFCVANCLLAIGLIGHILGFILVIAALLIYSNQVGSLRYNYSGTVLNFTQTYSWSFYLLIAPGVLLLISTILEIAGLIQVRMVKKKCLPEMQAMVIR